MENVTKKLPLLLSIFTALTLSGITVHQSGVIKHLKFDLGTTKKALADTKLELEEEMAKNEALEKERQILLDSISIMGFEIAELNDKVSSLSKKVANQNKKIQTQADQIAKLNKRINELKSLNGNHQAEIDRLQQQLERTLVEMDGEDKARAELMKLRESFASQEAYYKSEIDRLKAEIADRDAKPEAPGITNSQIGQDDESATAAAAPLPKINEAPADEQHQGSANIPESVSHKTLLNIVQNTSVNFLNVSLRQQEEGKELKKIKGDDWRYTYVAFDLDNLDKSAIMDQTFVLQLYDVDKDQVVPFNEQNNVFPGSNQGNVGYPFKYTGQPVLIKYYNYQDKSSANYEVRLIYMTTKMALPLKNGKLTIVEDSRVKPII